MFRKSSSRVEPGAHGGVEQNPFDQNLNWEAERIASLGKSERRAWRVAGGACVLTVAAIAAIAGLTPLKEREPYVIRVDNTTGHVDIITALDEKAVSYDEVMDTYWLRKFLVARETYDWYTIQADYDTVGALASPTVARDYASLFEGADALDKRWGRNYRVRVEITSVTPGTNGNGIGTVRFTKHGGRPEDAPGTGQVTRWIATVGYEYRNPSKMKSGARYTNPLGFTVTSYRIDPELGGSK